MDHTEAIRVKAVEGYLLGELSPTERQAFERHFFDCQECTRDLDAGSTFIDTLREAPAQAAPAPVTGRPMALVSPRPARSFQSIYALAASVLLAGVLLYQNMVTLPALRRSASPQAVESFSLESAGSRGAGATVLTPAKGKPFVILFDIPPGTEESEYRCEIRSGSGAQAASFSVAAAMAQRTIPVLIPAADLKPGTYTLVIRGSRQTAEPVAQYPFEIR